MGNSILIPQYGISITEKEMGKRKKWIDEPRHLDRFRLVMSGIPEFLQHYVNIVEAYNGNSRLYPSDSFETSKLSSKRVRNLYGYFVMGKNGGCDMFLDALFGPNESGFLGLQLESKHKVEDGAVVPKRVELLEECLDQICFADLDSLNEQGLPTKASEVQKYERGKNIYFIPPKLGSASRFRTSDVSVLNCGNVNPNYSGNRLGVLGCAEIPDFAQRWANLRSRKVYK